MPKLSPQPERHVVLLVHGIRTFGAWTERLARLLQEREPGVEIQHFRYGYFSAIAFFVPFLRTIIVRRLRRHLADHSEHWRGARVDIVAHSFGTYVVAWALRGLTPSKRPSIHTILLCGSVLRPTFPWNQLVGPSKAVRRLENHCGLKDWWPVVSEIFVLGTGIAGRTGFAGIVGPDVGIVNRYFRDVDHSGFFDQEFMVSNWLPVLTSDTIKYGPETVPPERFWLVAELEHYAEAWKLALWSLIILGPLWYWQSLKAENARAAAGRHVAEATALLYRDPHLAVVTALQGLDLYDEWSAEPGLVAAANSIANQAWRTVQARQAAFERAEESMRVQGLGHEFSAPLTDLLPMQITSDGRYLLLPVIKRESQPRGGLPEFDLYLWDNAELEMTRLAEPEAFPHAGDFNINYFSFDEAHGRVVVTRRFYVTFYDFEGEVVETYNASDKPRQNCFITKYEITFASIFADGETIVLSDFAGALWYVNLLHPCAPEPVVEMLVKEPVSKFVTDQSDELGLIVHSDGTAGLWLIRESLLLPIEHEVVSGAFRPQSKDEFFTRGRDGDVLLWRHDGEQLMQIHRVAMSNENIIYAKFTDDGDHIVTLTTDGTPALWEVQTGGMSWTTTSRANLSANGQQKPDDR